MQAYIGRTHYGAYSAHRPPRRIEGGEEDREEVAGGDGRKSWMKTCNNQYIVVYHDQWV